MIRSSEAGTHEAVISEETLKVLATYIVGATFGWTWTTEERHEDHSDHEDGWRHPECAHCAIHPYHDGAGYAVACGRLAVAIMAGGGPRRYRSERRRDAASL